MRAVTTALDVLAVLMVAVALVLVGAALWGLYGVALGLVVGAMFVAGSSAAATRPVRPDGES
jgi:hypothetical protein